MKTAARISIAVMAVILFFAFVPTASSDEVPGSSIELETYPRDLPRQLGIGSKNTVVIDNATLFYCDIYAYGKVLGKMAPQTSYSDSRRRLPNPSSMPVTAQCFEDQAGRIYVGSAGTIIELRYDRPGEKRWQITSRTLQLIDGERYIRTQPRPMELLGSATKHRGLPRESSPLVIHVVNNTPYRGELRRSSARGVVTEFERANLFGFKHALIGVGCRHSEIQIDFFDSADKLVGTWSRSFSACAEEERGEQYIIQRGDLNPPRR